MDDLHDRIDVALLPIETWGVRPPEGRHLSPRTATKALSLLKPRVAVPIHWGTLYLPGSAYAGKQATYAWFQKHAQAAGGVRRTRRRGRARGRRAAARPGRVAELGAERRQLGLKARPDLVVAGHVHVATASWVDGTLYLNPGTASAPDEEDDGPTAAIVECTAAGPSVRFVPLERRLADDGTPLATRGH